ncbi:DUF6236 family protein [Salinimonas sediminis]|uniref:Uncharacterized protein n=1 Tax=Salinimonas sediminis TaxID=2303538 RepID=A0A346NLV0_9ALTE|nr:DUF6236 family protein [Salinimonas sediminis]AXR06507.1 hypothetical protein D0Y50_09100 [Salinimonas sediminis]
MKRGIIVGQPFWIHNNQRHTRYLHGSELRKYLLFWDEIVYPDGPMLEKTINNPELQYLESVGVLQRHELIDKTININLSRFRTVNGKRQSIDGIDHLFSVHAQLEAYKIYSEREPGAWSLAKAGYFHQKADPRMGSALDIELLNMIPIPQRQVPFDDILNFKKHRRDELLAFRCFLDSIYDNIITSGDIPRAKNAEMARLELALLDLARTLRESKIEYVCKSLKAKISRAEFLGVAGLGYGLSQPILGSFNMNPIVAGTIMSGIVFLGSRAVFPSIPNIPKPLTYIASINEYSV